MPKINELEIKFQIKDPTVRHPSLKEFTLIYTLKFCNTSHRLGFLQKDGKIFFASGNLLRFDHKDGFGFFDYLTEGQLPEKLLHEINSTDFNLENVLSR